MLGIRCYEQASSDGEKADRLREIGRRVERRTHGRFRATQFVEDQINVHYIIEALNRTETKLRRICRMYGVQAGQQALRAAMGPGNGDIPDGAAERVLINAGEKLINMDLRGMQYMELIIINNAFQVSDPAQFDTNDADLATVYSFLSGLIEMKKQIHGSTVAQVNAQGYDMADLNLVASGRHVDDDDF